MREIFSQYLMSDRILCSWCTADGP